MPVKFWHSSLRFLLFLSCLITTVIENVYLVEKQNKDNFEIFFRRFVDLKFVKTCDEQYQRVEILEIEFGQSP